MRLIHELYIKLIKNLTINKTKYIFLMFLLSPFLIFIVLIKPIFFVRFGNLNTQRIGCFSSAEQYLLDNMHKKSKEKSLDIWIIDNYVCNKQLLVVLKRKFLIIKELHVFYNVLKLISKYINIYSKHIIFTSHARYYSHFSHIVPVDKYSCQLNLTRKEIIKGESILKSFGIPAKAKIVCIACRDNLYLKKRYPSKDFSYHNYRDINVDNYIPTIKALIKKNFYVVRMGQVSNKKINIKSNKFIDYPFHPLKNDFMDFFFAYKCYFWICNNVGLDEVARVFRKPLLDLNMAPLAGLKITSKKTLLCLKVHKNYNNKKLSLNEIFDSGVANAGHSEEYRRKKIKLNELNASQIKDIVLEMIKLMKDSWKIKNKNDLKLQKKFKKLYLSRIKKIDPKCSYKKVNALYSLVFLKKNPWFLK